MWSPLRSWWLAHEGGANTPNWDIGAACEIEGTPGLILVEAKANVPELSVAGKAIDAAASPASVANHERIGRAIEEACWPCGRWMRRPPSAGILTINWLIVSHLRGNSPTLGVPTVLVTSVSLAIQVSPMQATMPFNRNPLLGAKAPGPRHSKSRYWLVDWPSFLFRSAAAWYFTTIGVIGALLILSSMGMLVAY